eukprot:g7442.t1
MKGGGLHGHLELPKPSRELIGVKSHDELQTLLLARQQEVVRNAGTDPSADLRQQEEKGALSPRSLYQKNKIAREQLSLQLLMHLNGEQMASIKAEFHAHDDEVDLEDFCDIMERHQPENLIVTNRGGSDGGDSDGDGSKNSDDPNDEDAGGRANRKRAGGGGSGGTGAVGGKVAFTREEVISNLVELFKEVDINGDGMMEWDEFTRFVVVKAQLHHAQMSIDQLAEYRQGSRQVEVVSYNRCCETVEQLCYIPGSHQLAVIQEHNPIVNIYNSQTWARVAQLKHNAVPLTMAYCEDHHTLVTASADMTLLQWYLDDIPSIKHYTLKSRWPTKHAAMSMCWSSSHRLLYSGTTAGTIQGWDIGERQEMVTLKGHSDIVMGMMVMQGLDNLVSASLDTSIRVWDTYTQKPVQTLQGHNKGVHSLSYSSQYRCLISAGFDHEAHVWSPFVNSLLNRLKGHHASLVGCQAVEGTPELITADSSGVVKLWDIRTFHCVQTFQANNDGDMPRDKSSTSCFVHFKMPPFRSNQEQVREWTIILEELENPEERKFILGNAKGEVAVYNFRNGAKMKDLDTQAGPIAGLVYCAREKAVLVACQDGDMVCFDEMDPDKAVVLVNFEGGGSAYSEDLNNVAYSHCNGLVATSSCNPEDGILIWGFGTGRQEHVLAHGKAEGLVSSMTSLVFLDPHPLLLATYSDGTIRVWGVKGSPLKGLLVLTFFNQAPKEACFWGGEDAEYPLLRLKPPAASPQTPMDGTEENQDERGSADGTSEGSTASFEDNRRQGGAVAVDGDREATNQEETDEDHEFSEWRVPPRMTPRKAMALQVISTTWDSTSACLFTGDETGRLRCWSLRKVLEALGAEPSREAAAGEDHLYSLNGESEGGGGGRRGEGEDGRGTGSTLRTQDSAGTRASLSSRRKCSVNLTMPPPPATKMSEDMIDFLWGAESAHEDSIGLIVFVSTDPPALLTSGADRCVKAWRLDGRPQGLLLQGLAPHAPNPRWSFSVNVEALAQAENGEAKTVLSAMRNRRAEKRLAAQEAVNAATLPDPTPQRHHQNHHHYHHHHQHRRKRSSGVSLPPAQPSPLKQAQLVRQRKEITAAMARATLEKGSSTDGFGDERSMPGADGSRGEKRLVGLDEAARRLASQVASEGAEDYSKSDSFSDWRSFTSSASYSRYKDRPSVVPPSPGRRRGRPSAGLSAVVDRLGKLLDQAESFSAEHTNRFGGRRSNLSDFAKGAMLADPRRTASSDASANTTKLPSTVSGKAGMR